ncbi:MAG: peptidase M6 [Thermoleophilia bacterium]|nr:peptidase M6 [Thermoleophilia bacterium]
MKATVTAAILALAVAASLAATAAAAKPRPLSAAQRACLVKAVGKKNADLYAKGARVSARTKAAVTACTKAATSANAAPAGAPCATLSSTDAYLSEGPWNVWDAAVNLRSTGKVRATVLFVDFPDSVGTASPQSIVDGWMAQGVSWLSGTSYGRLSLALDAHSAWLRMPKAASAYGWDDYSISYDDHLYYLRDAFTVADPKVDFAHTDLVYVVAPPTRMIPFSPTFRGEPGAFILDGKKVDKAVTFGQDAYTYGKTVLPHETGHLFGLPDLYSLIGGDQHRFVGVWDFMGNIFDPTDLSAWHRLKLGYLDASQIACADSGKTTEATLTALGATGGVKAVVAKTSPTTVVVVENRQKVGNDAGICEVGALVYSVDATPETGAGPMKVQGGAITGQGCGYGARSDAPLQPGESVTVAGVAVTVISRKGTDVVVRVTAP